MPERELTKPPVEFLQVAHQFIAAQSKRHPSYSKYRDNSPAAVAARQRNARTFDGTQYYEHNLNKIPLGTQAWWDQWGRENGGTRP